MAARWAAGMEKVMAFKVTYTPEGKKPRDMVTGIQSRAEAEAHRKAYAKQAQKGDSAKVERDGKKR